MQAAKSSFDILSFVNDHIPKPLSFCYQCGKCSAGCPLSYQMDILPSKIVRLIQLGQKDIVLSSTTIWLCASCNICSERCPRYIDVQKIMDLCRAISYRERRRAAEPGIAAFHEIFLDTVYKHGHMYELMVAADLNLKTGHPFKDITLVPALLHKHKLTFAPHNMSAEIKKSVQSAFAFYQRQQEDDDK